MLTVEDNSDLRAYMRDIMHSGYRIKEAADGIKGLHQAFQMIPDLIISDVMMPVMGGIKMCEKLKTDERTSHIPIVLLTARAGLDSRLQGLETGADDYIVKPFETKELLLRVKNLLDNRRKLRERFGKDFNVNPREIGVTSMDEKFLHRAIDIIEEYMADADFSVEQFARAVGLSRVQLHRKLRALTNQSATDFIKILRLKRAASLLKQRSGNIAEIAYEVGFNKPSYFADCFRKQFGQLPSEYIADHP
ncbi:DNA-binding response regulator [candidate division KSB1 bacterium]|nr:MAG: DNA-binding response regulator [candidate division KSB1 bacterium]